MSEISARDSSVSSSDSNLKYKAKCFGAAGIADNASPKICFTSCSLNVVAAVGRRFAVACVAAYAVARSVDPDLFDTLARPTEPSASGSNTTNERPEAGAERSTVLGPHPVVSAPSTANVAQTVAKLMAR